MEFHIETKFDPDARAMLLLCPTLNDKEWKETFFLFFFLSPFIRSARVEDATTSLSPTVNHSP